MNRLPFVITRHDKAITKGSSVICNHQQTPSGLTSSQYRLNAIKILQKETKVTLIKEKTEKKVIQKFNLFDIFIYLQP